jgi:hypothetical protein
MSAILPRLPNELWAKILGELDLRTTQAVWETCEHARELIREHISDEAIEGLALQVLRQKEFSLSSVIPICLKNKEFVCLAVLKNWKNYELIPNFRLDRKVLKTAAISVVFLEGRGIRNNPLEQLLENIGEGSFVNNLRAVPTIILYYQLEYIWNHRTSEKFREIYSDFVNNKKFLLAATAHNAMLTLRYLRMIKSNLVEDRDILLTAANQNAEGTFKHLREINSNLVQDREFLLLVAALNAEETLHHLYIIDSNLVQDREFLLLVAALNAEATLQHLHLHCPNMEEDLEVLFTTIGQDIWATFIHLGNIRSDLIDNRELLLAAARKDAYETLDYFPYNLLYDLSEDREIVLIAIGQNAKPTLRHLRKHKSSLSKDREILLTAARQDAKATLHHLIKIESDLVYDEDLVFATKAPHGGGYILYHRYDLKSNFKKKWEIEDRVDISYTELGSPPYRLLRINSDLLEDKEILLATADQDALATIDYLHSLKSDLLEDESFMKTVEKKCPQQPTE